MFSTIEEQHIRALPAGLTITGLIAELQRRLEEDGDLQISVHHAGNPKHQYRAGQWWRIPVVQTQVHGDRLWLVH
jgi:hypothetical protein